MCASYWARIRPIHVRRCLFSLLMTGSVMSCARSEGPDSEGMASPGAPVFLTVTPFEAGDSLPQQWNSADFADSLAARLRSLPNVNVGVAPHAAASVGFALRGSVSVRNGRLIVGARLSHTGDSSPAWTATFWRSDGPLSSLVDAVASGAAEALGAEMARRSIRKNERK